MKQSRDFKGVWIPKDLYLNEKLTPTEKFLLAEIDSLSSDERGCFASNQYLSEFLQITKGAAANMISKLRQAGFINQYSYDEKTGEREMRCIFKVKHSPVDASGSHEDEGGVHPQMKGGSSTDEGGVHTDVNPYNKVDNKVDNKEEKAQPNVCADPVLFPDTETVPAKKKAKTDAVTPTDFFSAFDKPEVVAETWQRWKTFKKEQFRFTYKSGDSEKTAIKSLHKLSDGKAAIASQIVEHSIGNGYRGLFEVKTPKSAASIDANLADCDLTQDEFASYQKTKSWVDANYPQALNGIRFFTYSEFKKFKQREFYKMYQYHYTEGTFKRRLFEALKELNDKPWERQKAEGLFPYISEYLKAHKD